MKTEEYEIMYRVEDRHWWYVALRGMINDCWRSCVKGARPLVLDAGCGTGATLALLADRARTVGIDYSREGLKFCRRRNQHVLANASITDLPFADGAFDIVISLDVLCHKSIADKESTLRELIRVARPGGTIIVNLPAYQWLMSSHDVHVFTNHRFTRAEVRGIFQRAGCEVVRATYWNSLLFPAVAAVRLWRKIRPLKASDLDDASGESLNGVFGVLMALERWTIRLTPMPVGLSVLVAARKT